MPAPPLANVVDTGKQVIAKTADDINDLFKELDSEAVDDKATKIPEKKEASKKTEGETPKEDEELELVEPEEDIEKLDFKEEAELEIDAPPRKKEILSKYPDLFKTFPFLEK